MHRRIAGVKLLGLLAALLLLLEPKLNAQIAYSCDALGNLYAVHADHIDKHSNNFNMNYRLSTLQYGTSALLDLTNPLVPFLFFQDQGSLVFFDNMLNVLEDPVFLNEQFQGQISCVGGSKGDAFWVFDVNANVLIRSNRKFEILSRSANLATLTKSSFQPVQIIENGNRVYLIDQSEAIYVFTLFGNLEYKSDYTYSDHVVSWENGLFFRNGNTLYEWKNTRAAPSAIANIDLAKMNEKNTWLICDGKPFYVQIDTGEMQEIAILENLEK